MTSTWSPLACLDAIYCIVMTSCVSHDPANILYKYIADRYRLVRVADGPITARYRFIENASWGALLSKSVLVVFEDVVFFDMSHHVATNYTF